MDGLEGRCCRSRESQIPAWMILAGRLVMAIPVPEYYKFSELVYMTEPLIGSQTWLDRTPASAYFLLKPPSAH